MARRRRGRLLARPGAGPERASDAAASADGIGGIATSGRQGRSFSLGIADSVTVLARDAAGADAAATLIANAVDLPGHPAIRRTPARALDPDSDLGDRPVTTAVGPLEPDEVAAALAAGRACAEAMRRRGLIHDAALMLRGRGRRARPLRRTRTDRNPASLVSGMCYEPWIGPVRGRQGGSGRRRRRFQRARSVRRAGADRLLAQGVAPRLGLLQFGGTTLGLGDHRRRRRADAAPDRGPGALQHLEPRLLRRARQARPRALPVADGPVRRAGAGRHRSPPSSRCTRGRRSRCGGATGWCGTCKAGCSPTPRTTGCSSSRAPPTTRTSASARTPAGPPRRRWSWRWAS